MFVLQEYHECLRDCANLLSARQAQKERAAERKETKKKKTTALVNAGKLCRSRALQKLNAAEGGITGDHESDVNSVSSSASVMNSPPPLNGKAKYLKTALSGMFDEFLDRMATERAQDRERQDILRAQDRGRQDME